MKWREPQQETSLATMAVALCLIGGSIALYVAMIERMLP